MRKDPIQLILGVGFTIVLALMALISFISLNQMGDATEEMSQLFRETQAKISAAHTMRDSIRLRGDTLHKMYLTEDFIERDKLRIQMSEHAMQYKVARNALYSYPMSAREAKLLDILVKRTREARFYNDSAADDLLSDKPDYVVRDMVSVANQARSGMLDGLSELVELQDEIAQSKLKDTQKYQNSLATIILLLCLTAIAIAIFIAQRVIRETAKKSSEIQYHATHDNLTQLPNRMEFNIRLENAFNSAIEHNQRHILCFLDLDKFKIINDTCGHRAGDKLLKNITGIIQSHIRSRDTLARLGGDEFGLLLEDCSLEKAIHITEGIVELVKDYEFKWKNQSFYIGVSIGIVAITNKSQSTEALLGDADSACYAAKDLGRNQVHVHGQSGSAAIDKQDEFSWLSDIDNDDEDRFSLYLQAIKPVSGKPLKDFYQVLLRFNDEEGQLIAPGEYLPAAERFSLMKNVDFWVVDKSFRFLHTLKQKSEQQDIKLFINISANSLSDPDFVEFVIKHYLHFNISHESICFEVDEERAVNNGRAIAAAITSLKPYGIDFALDDFGKGVSSISHLKDLPVNYLKINGDVVKNITQSITDRALVTAIADIGKVMNMKVIANHVENAFVQNQLREMNIDYIQGYYVNRPCALDDCFGKTDQVGKHSTHK